MGKQSKEQGSERRTSTGGGGGGSNFRRESVKRGACKAVEF